MPTARATGVAESDDEYAPPSQGAARGAKKHPVTEAVLRFATEKKGPKAGPYVNKIFEQAIEGAEQEATQIEGDDDDARAVPIANMLMMIVAWLYYFIKIEWLDEIVESSEHLAKKARASAGSAISALRRTATSAVPAKANAALFDILTLITNKWFGVIWRDLDSLASRASNARAPSLRIFRARARTGTRLSKKSLTKANIATTTSRR